jgi:hypothetical protein
VVGGELRERLGADPIDLHAAVLSVLSEGLAQTGHRRVDLPEGFTKSEAIQEIDVGGLVESSVERQQQSRAENHELVAATGSGLVVAAAGALLLCSHASGEGSPGSVGRDDVGLPCVAAAKRIQVFERVEHEVLNGSPACPHRDGEAVDFQQHGHLVQVPMPLDQS